MGTVFEERNARLSKTLLANLEKRRFEAYYCPTAKDALEKIISLIPQKSSVAWGGSSSLREMGLTKTLHDGDYTVIDRDLAKTPEEKYQMHRDGLLVDYFLTSTNAISEDGILVNIDGNGNRVAAYCFGPKNVIVVCGMNKVTQTLDAAISRARGYAAPINSMRFLGKTPCTSTGVCHNCVSPECICNQILITRGSFPQNRIKVILVGEELGF